MSERRQRILNAAERLFRHYGPAKTTMADIAKACGIAVGSLYLDFESKDTILRELAATKNQAVVAAMRKVNAEHVPTRIVQMFTKRIDVLFDLAEHGQHACELIHCRSVAAARGLHSNRDEQIVAPADPAHQSGLGDEVRTLLGEALTQGIARGELEIENVAVAVDTFDLAFRALSPPALFLRSRQDAVVAASHLATMLVYGVSKPRRAP